MKVNWKKKKMKNDQSNEIERENRILLEKMRRIYCKESNKNRLSKDGMKSVLGSGSNAG